jgi:hypothetical protein
MTPTKLAKKMLSWLTLPPKEFDYANFVGPFAGPFVETFTGSGDVWSPCGGEGLLNINVQARLTTGTGSITIDNEGADNSVVAAFRWRTC